MPTSRHLSRKAVVAVLNLMLSASMLYAMTADRIVAVVNDTPITQSEIDEVIIPYYLELEKEHSGSALMAKIEEARRNVLNQIVEDKLIYLEAQELGVKVSEEEINKMMDHFEQQFSSPEEMENALRARGTTATKLRQSYRRQIAIRKLHAYQVQSRVVISPIDIQNYYEEHASEFMEEGHRVLSSITLRKLDQDIQKGTASEAQREKIESILERIRSGESFHDLARRYSEDARAREGGEMESAAVGSLMPAIESSLKTLHAGEVTDVIETETSYHLFRLDEFIPSRRIPLDDVRDTIRERLYREEMETRYKEWIEDLKQKAFITVVK